MSLSQCQIFDKFLTNASFTGFICQRKKKCIAKQGPNSTNGTKCKFDFSAYGYVTKILYATRIKEHVKYLILVHNQANLKIPYRTTRYELKPICKLSQSDEITIAKGQQESCYSLLGCIDRKWIDRTCDFRKVIPLNTLLWNQMCWVSPFVGRGWISSLPIKVNSNDTNYGVQVR